MNEPTPDPFPVDSFREAAPYLRRPFSPYAVKWKVQTTLANNRGLIVAFIDVRLVYERLNLVCPDLWEIDVKPYGERVDSKNFVCDMTIDGLRRPNVGNAAAGEGVGVKGGYSDAIKRAAVAFGVGVSLYAVPKQILESADKPKAAQLARRKKGQKVTLFITDGAEAFLRERYADWLDTYGIGAFGDVVDHGDSEDSIGGLVDGADEEPAQEDLELAGARQELEKMYAETIEPDPKLRRKLPARRFRAQLEEANAEEIVELAHKIEELAP